MKFTILSTLLIFLPLTLFAAEQITVEAKFIELNKEAIPHDFAKLSQAKGIDFLSAPRVTTKSGQQAQMAVTREYQPTSVAPSVFQPIPIGITVRVTPLLKGDRIAYSAQLTISELVTSKASNGHTRSEITSRDLYVSGTSKDGEEVWFDFSELSNGKKIVVWLHFKHEVA